MPGNSVVTDVVSILTVGVTIDGYYLTGLPDGMGALLAGQVQCMASGPGPIAPHVRSGALRPLATWGRTRLAGFEDVPTLIEKGFPDCEFYIWVGLFAPTGTPAPVIARIRDASRQVAADAEFRRAMTASGNTLDFREGDAFAAFYAEDAARLVRVVRALGKIE